MTDWIIEQAGTGGTVGIDGLVYAASDAKALKTKLDAKGIRLETSLDPFATIWKDRPVILENKVFTLPDCVAGEPVTSKIAPYQCRIEKGVDADGLIIVTLDAVAWTFNLRGGKRRGLQPRSSCIWLRFGEGGQYCLSIPKS
jgi:Xaa-Pro aminopeptidase